MSQKKRVPIANPKREAARLERERRHRRGQIAIAATVTATVLIVAAIVTSVLVNRGPGEDANAGQPSTSSAPTSDGGDTASGEVTSTNNAVGKVFPDFTLTTPDGKKVTRASLKGKPALIWFTTSICTPCQQGAIDVAKVDDETNGKAFDVLVVFVDPREPESELTKWRATYARPDWTVALDAQSKLSSAVKLQYLDTKFLLDERGTILNVDLQPVNDNYLGILRDALKA